MHHNEKAAIVMNVHPKHKVRYRKQDAISVCTFKTCVVTWLLHWKIESYGTTDVRFSHGLHLFSYSEHSQVFGTFFRNIKGLLENSIQWSVWLFGF